MEVRQTPTPNVCMFKEDHDVLKDFVSRSDGPRIGIGDLFGFWTDADKELAVHLVTGQLETENQLGEEPSGGVKRIRKTLRDDFRLPRIGKWVYKRDSLQTRNEIAHAMHAEKGLFVGAKTPPKFGLLIMVSYDKSTNRMQLSPYLVSNTTVSTKGTIEFLRGENVFLKVEEIRKLTGNSAKHISRSGRKEVKVTLSSANYHLLLPTERTDFFNLKQVTSHADWQTHELRVFIYENDIKMMEELVLQYPNEETGGDLFGLWTSGGDAVMHIVLGPGKKCRRTDVSFNPDIPYLQWNGELMTEEYMLCHIGEWHSHHQLRIFQPRHGESSTVIRNYPRDVRGFILIIANIYAPGKVKLSPYVYTQESRSTYDKTGEVIPLQVPNAFKGICKIKNTIEQGKETELDVQRNRALCQLTRL